MNWKSLLRVSEGHQPKTRPNHPEFSRPCIPKIIFRNDSDSFWVCLFLPFFYCSVARFCFRPFMNNMHTKWVQNGVITTNWRCCWYCGSWIEFYSIEMVAISFRSCIYLLWIDVDKSDARKIFQCWLYSFRFVAKIQQFTVIIRS